MNILGRIISNSKKVLMNPRLLISFIASKNLLNWMPHKQYLKLLYFAKMKKSLNIDNPKTYNEKLQWLKLYDRNPEYTQMVDKYEVRKYISETIGEEYLIPLLGVYNTYDDIKFDQLPNQFVLKPNHTSGNVFICKDKSKIDYMSLKKEVDMWLKREYFWIHREWPYKNVESRIICEKYMVDESGTELKDYKFMCFNGKVKCSFVCLNRYLPTGLNVDFYDMDWNPMPFERHYPRSGTIIPKPKTFDKMVRFAEKLSKDIPFVRVDFYEINGQLYFGELTFSPGSGYEEFTPESYDYLLGSWLGLPSKIDK